MMMRDAEKEAALAQELERRKNEEARKAMVIEKVRAEAPELRELEQKLRAAYMNQERRKQLEEKVIMDEQERERRAIAAAIGANRKLAASSP